MKLQAENVLSSANFLGYYETARNWKDGDFILESLFPIKRVQGLSFSYIKGRGGIAGVLSPSAFDTEAIIKDRGGFDMSKGELPLFKNKMTLGERERQDLTTFLQAQNESAVASKVAEIFDDRAKLMDDSLHTLELLRAKALMNGCITMEYDGGKIDCDYGLLPEQKKVLTGADLWSDATADVIQDILDWQEETEIRTGAKPDSMIMNPATFKHVKGNTAIQTEMVNLGRNGRSNEAVKGYIEEVTGVRIFTYNKKYENEAGVTVDLIEDGKIALFPSGVSLGNTLTGTSPMEFDKGNATNKAEVEVTSQGIAVSTWGEVDPVRLYTSAELVALPSFPQAHLVVIATVA